LTVQVQGVITDAVWEAGMPNITRVHMIERLLTLAECCSDREVRTQLATMAGELIDHAYPKQSKRDDRPTRLN
jgi:hypothetical protein